MNFNGIHLFFKYLLQSFRFILKKVLIQHTILPCINPFLSFFAFDQLYVPDEDKSIFGRSVNKQVFEGLTTGLLQTIATILESLWPNFSESGKGENAWISSPDAKVKSSATESFSTRAQDLIRYFPLQCNVQFSCCFSSSYVAAPFLILQPFYPIIIHPSFTPVYGIEGWSTSSFLKFMPFVKNRLTKCQITWKWSKWSVVRMGVVWEWGVLWHLSSLYFFFFFTHSEPISFWGRFTK